MDAEESDSSGEKAALVEAPLPALDWDILLSLDEDLHERRSAAWDEVYMRYTPLIRPTIEWIVGRGADDGNEVLAMTWEKAYLALLRPDANRPTAFLGWLKTVASTRAFDFLRQRGREERRRAEFEQRSPDERAEYLYELISDETFQSDELRTRFGERLNGLDQVDRDVLSAYAEGYRHHEIATLLGITPAASRKRLQRAREMLNTAKSRNDG